MTPPSPPQSFHAIQCSNPSIEFIHHTSIDWYSFPQSSNNTHTLSLLIPTNPQVTFPLFVRALLILTSFRPIKFIWPPSPPLPLPPPPPSSLLYSHTISLSPLKVSIQRKSRGSITKRGLINENEKREREWEMGTSLVHPIDKDISLLFPDPSSIPSLDTISLTGSTHLILTLTLSLSNKC